MRVDPEQAERAANVARDSSLQRLHGLIGALNGDLDLERTLRAVAQGVVDSLGFALAVVNLVVDSGDLEVVTVAGPREARDALLGTTGSRGVWEAYMAQCEPVGALLVDYSGQDHFQEVPTWVSQAGDNGHEQAWHAWDVLIAPLRTARSGLLGVISVDLPKNGLRPGPEQLELLEMYAAQAALSVENARLHTRLLARDAEREEALGRLSALVAEAPVAIIELDLEGRIRLWNPAAEQIFGWRREEVLGLPNPTVDQPGYPAAMARLANGEGLAKAEVRRWRKDGSEVDVELSSAVLRGVDGRPFGYIGVLVDVTERLRMQDELRAAARTDPLTGLANRTRLQTALADAVADSCDPVVLLLDLDGFKAVNDSLGHDAGDVVLRQVAERLRRTCRAGELVARLGGDEFVVLVRRQELGACLQLGRRLVDVLREPFHVGGRPAVLGASVGVAPYRPGDTPEQLLRNADTAMYGAKNAGKGQVMLFGAPPHTAAAAAFPEQRPERPADLGAPTTQQPPAR